MAVYPPLASLDQPIPKLETPSAGRSALGAGPQATDRERRGDIMTKQSVTIEGIDMRRCPTNFDNLVQ